MAWQDLRKPAVDRASALVLVLGALAAIALFAATEPASAGKTFTTFYEFTGGSDGWAPYGPLISDANGNLYGTTYFGGDLSICAHGCGTVFKLAPDGSKTILHLFEGRGHDGSHPTDALLLDGKGNLYGTTAHAGGGNGCADGCGTVFKIAPDGTETVLHAFAGRSSDGGVPYAGLIKDKSGNLYGTTSEGGSSACNTYGCGTVFMLSKTGVETVLHALIGGTDGWAPLYGSLLRDAGGNLYGTTLYGGTTSCPASDHGCGTVFKLAADGTETILHVFAGGAGDGAAPQGGVIADANGNLYGTTFAGGAGGCTGNGCGTVFELAPDGTETILHSFAGGSGDGVGPSSTLLLKAGNLFGTTQGGGSALYGTVFRLSATGDLTLLHSFTSGDDGRNPLAGLISGAGGSLFGTSVRGGDNACQLGCGTVFKLQ